MAKVELQNRILAAMVIVILAATFAVSTTLA
jgi:hypothetical protein